MASFRQRSGTWQARVRTKGFPDEVKSFSTKSEAVAWAREVEASMYKGSYQDTSSAKDWLLGELLRRYMVEVSPTKRSAKREREAITFMLRQRMAAYSMAKLTPAVLAAYRNERMMTISAGTIIRELSILSSAISHARREWGLPTDNPCALVRKPQSPQGRQRLLTYDERKRLLEELHPVGRRSPWMRPFVELALETAMRRGELLALEWKHINLSAQTAFLEMAKNGTSRTVPLSKAAVAQAVYDDLWISGTADLAPSTSTNANRPKSSWTLIKINLPFDSIETSLRQTPWFVPKCASNPTPL
ncbi:tyrosine-type recombinase/integrase [Massilia sp. YIM B04103]|uniref:tyrosine-type recombinase/integrase n=1 Tax=Massilia sp. YIM B04103 TaxID=2963106 RepID=UPI00210AADE5|nr:tyrosine-type recombinase/integrase [Massilia sp. YIM B04103]